MPEKKKKEEPKQYDGQNLRELSDDELEMYKEAYPTNIWVNGEIKRRKEERLKQRRTTTVGK